MFLNGFFKKASQSSRPRARIQFDPFSLAACTSEKILLGPQTWELSANGGQFLRCGGPHPLSEKAKGLFRQSSGVEWLLVGLGNPGGAYEGTRHNVGFLALDEAAELAGVPVQKLKYRALTNTCQLEGAKVLLMKPITYMNLSGVSVGEAVRFYKLPPERVLVFSDDVSLPVGRLRVRRGGSAGGHNGLKSIIEHLGSDQFPRIKIGVGGKPHPDYDMADWVLGKFPPEDQKIIDQMVQKAAQAAAYYIKEGPDKTMGKFN